MLHSVTRLCGRNCRRILAPIAHFYPIHRVESPTTLRPSRTLHRTASCSPWLHVARTEPQRRGLSGSLVLRSSHSRDVGHSDSLTAPKCLAESGQAGEDFGMLSGDMARKRSYRKGRPELWNLEYEEDEEKEPVRPLKYGRGNTTHWYFLQCKKLIKANKLQEALDMFSIDMLKGERLQPEVYNYTILIGGCGRAAQLKKAFRLYNDMKKRGLVPSDATYTALFNACAESRSKEEGLKQAVKLEQELRRKNYPLSDKTYHALLKTHALNNHLQACLHTFKEMLQNGNTVTQETFHYLMMASVNDKETGFRMALQVWRQMLKSGIRPDQKNYNLLLRTARDCGIGDSSQASDLLLSSDRTGHSRKQHRSKAKRGSGGTGTVDIDLLERQLLIQPGHSDDSGVRDSGVTPSAEEESHRRQNSSLLVMDEANQNFPVVSPCNQLGPVAVNPPNLLDLFEGERSSVISIGTVNKASDRLALIGGPTGFLEKMAADGQSPDLKTLTLLADTMEPSSQSLQSLLRVAKQHKVKLDVAFFNTVIRRAARAGDLDEAKAVLKVMKERNVSVDVQTYGSLALGCKQQNDGLQLISDMKEAGLKPNVQVFGALIGQAVRRLDYIYLKALLRSMSELGVWPNEVIIKQLEFAAQYPPSFDQYKSRNNYLIQINGFRGYYQQWLKCMPALGPDEEQLELQPEADEAQEKVPDEDLTETQRKQRAASRRFNTHRKNRQGSAESPF